MIKHSDTVVPLYTLKRKAHLFFRPLNEKSKNDFCLTGLELSQYEIVND